MNMNMTHTGTVSSMPIMDARIADLSSLAERYRCTTV